MSDTSGNPFRLVEIVLDANSIARRGPDIAHERNIAIFDLIEANSFTPTGSSGGPYRLMLSVEEGRLVFDIRLTDDSPHGRVILSFTPFRRIVRDYFMVCDSYHAAIRNAAPSQIEAIDMGRRGLHNEGSDLLRDRLKGKIDIDFDTARRLFTLLCALHWRD